MPKIENVLPSNFKLFNNTTYCALFRLGSGEIAVERYDNITIHSSKEDSVKLVTPLDEVRLWMINNCHLYAIASSSRVDVPEGIIFLDSYVSSHYPEGRYIKYAISGKCGILYLSETEISTVISHEKGYDDICFEDNLFYANFTVPAETADACHVIDESGELFCTLPHKCQKIKGYMIFFDEANIFVGSSKFEVPNGIYSAEIIVEGDISLMKIVNSTGIYYYDKQMAYLLGPVQHVKYIGLNKSSCYLYEMENEKIIRVFYINSIASDDHYLLGSISCKKSIEVYPIDNSSTKDIQYIFIIDNASGHLVVPKTGKFQCLFNDIDADTYTFNNRNSETTIIGLKDNKPIYFATYKPKDKKITDESKLEPIGHGYEDSYFCKNSDGSFIVIKGGKILFTANGKNFSMKKILVKPNDPVPIPVYVFEDDTSITIYTADGKLLS